MGNLGGGEILVILLLALIVLGPQRLPEAARQIGRFMGELRRISTGFQRELRSALDDATEQAARERGAAVRSGASAPPPSSSRSSEGSSEGTAAGDQPPTPSAAETVAGDEPPTPATNGHDPSGAGAGTGPDAPAAPIARAGRRTPGTAPARPRRTTPLRAPGRSGGGAG